MITPLITMPGGWELIVIVLLIVLLFGARKLPELARGTGQALRIFKAETKGLSGEEDEARHDQDSGQDAADDTTDENKQPGPAAGTSEQSPDGNGR